MELSLSSAEDHTEDHTEDFFMDGSSQGDSQNLFSQQAVLTQGDMSDLAQFFNNPNNVHFTDNSDVLDFSHDQRMTVNGLGGDANYDSVERTINNPAATLAAAAPATYRTHSDAPLYVQNHMANFVDNKSTDNSAPDELSRAASHLIGLSGSQVQTQAQAQAQAQASMSHGGASSWGNFFNSNVASPAPDHMLPNPTAVAHHMSPGSNYNSVMQNPMSYEQQANLHRQQMRQAQMQWNQSHPRPTSLNLHTGFQHMPSTQYPQSAYPQLQNIPYQQHQQQRAGLPQAFGSDPNFSNSGYCGPDLVAREQEKAGNLLAVPFKEELSSTGHTRTNGSGPLSHMQTGAYTRQSLPDTSFGFHNGANNNRGIPNGLPVTAPPTSMRPDSRAWTHTHHRRGAVDEDDDDEIHVAQPKTRKRRKSTMDDDDEAEYNPGTHVTGNKRGPKVPKAEVASEDEDDVAFETPKNKFPAKRRKPAPAGRDSIGSISASPSESMSRDSAEQSSSKKRGRGTGGSRHNLSEAEKRANHIHSEQKRRNVIKCGMEDLQHLVPNLKGGKSGLSRADQVQEVYAFVKEIVSGNEQIEQLLRLSLDDMVDADAEELDEEEG